MTAATATAASALNNISAQIVGRTTPHRFLAPRFDVPRLEDFRDGTFAPFLRDSLRAMAIACFRLVTFRPDPLFSVPFFFRRIVDSTFFCAALPYLAIVSSP
jgi:hypothetical protein